MPLLSLLHLCDSLFPIGSFAYSDGLESAAASGLVTGTADLAEWLEICSGGGIRPLGRSGDRGRMAGGRGRGLGGCRRDRRRAHGAAGLLHGAPGESIDGAAPVENLAGTAPRRSPRADAGTRRRSAGLDRRSRSRSRRSVAVAESPSATCSPATRMGGWPQPFPRRCGSSRSDKRTLTSCSAWRWRGCRHRSTSSLPGRRVRNRSLRHSTSPR